MIAGVAFGGGDMSEIRSGTTISVAYSVMYWKVDIRGIERAKYVGGLAAISGA